MPPGALTDPAIAAAQGAGGVPSGGATNLPQLMQVPTYYVTSLLTHLLYELTELRTCFPTYVTYLITDFLLYLATCVLSYLIYLLAYSLAD